MVRYHGQLRQRLFSPLGTQDLVQAQRLLPRRKTEVILEDGTDEVVEDDWTDPKVSHRDISKERRKGQKWFGRTIFELKPLRSVRRWSIEEVDEQEAAASADEAEVEESEEHKRSKAAAEPSKQQREEHLEQNHAVCQKPRAGNPAPPQEEKASLGRL